MHWLNTENLEPKTGNKQPMFPPPITTYSFDNSFIFQIVT